MTFLSSEVFFVLLLAYNSVQGTLMPNGVIALDCGSQQTFTCTVTNVAVWTIEGLDGISVSTDTGEVAGRDNGRINTTETGLLPSSTITISEFSASDDGGTIQCIDLSSPSVILGMANISVGIPFCPLNETGATAIDCDRANVTWEQPPNSPVIASTTVTYCPILFPNCGNSTTCTSPCTISGLDPGTEYQFTVIPNNNCGSPTGCIGNMAAARTPCLCAVRTSEPTSIVVPVLAGTIPSTVSIIINIISVVVVFLITRHCYKKTSQKSSPLKEGGDVYEQVEGRDIQMTTSPAYGPVV